MRNPNASDARRFQARDPEELKREADAIRADLDRTLHALERKLSPRQIKERSLEFVRKNGSEFLDKARRAAEQNPWPFMLASAGLMWFASSRRSARKQDHHYESDDSYDADDYVPPMQHRSGDFDLSTQSFQHRAAARERTLETGMRLGEIIRKRPLVFGTVAVALGAVAAAALPATQYERGVIARARNSLGPLIHRATEAMKRRADTSL